MDSDPATSDSNTFKGESSLKRFLCFFCLGSRDLDIYETCDKESDVHQLSLRNISRYLHLSNYDIKENRLSNLEGKTVWSICKQCCLVATEFNALYHLGEEIKLRLNWCLAKIQNVMTKAEEDSQVKTATDIKDDDDDWNLRKILRTAMKDRAKGITPRVEIFKTQVTKQSVAMSMSSVLEEDDCHVDGMDLDAEYYDDDDNISSPEMKQVFAPVNPEIKKECDEMDNDETPQTQESIKISIKIKNKKLKCSFCRAEFQMNGMGRSVHRRHVVQYHGDQLFPNSKLDSVTDSQFKQIVGGLLFKDLIRENCVYCKRKFKSPKNKKESDGKLSYACKIKRHLVENHFERIEQKLRKLQATPDVMKSLVECDSLGEVCECGAYLQNSWSRLHHEARYCSLVSKNKLQTLTSTCKTNFMSDFVMVSNKFKCKSCKKTFANRCSALKHWQYYCPVNKGKRPSIEKEEDSLICEYCRQGFARRGHVTAKQAMKEHYVRKHPEHYFPTFSKGTNLGNFKRILERVLIPKFALKDKDSKPTSCPCSLCGAKFTRKDWFRRHLINKHIHQLKESLKRILEDDDATLVPGQENYFSKRRKSLKPVVAVVEPIKIDNKQYDATIDIDPLGTD